MCFLLLLEISCFEKVEDEWSPREHVTIYAELAKLPETSGKKSTIPEVRLEVKKEKVKLAPTVKVKPKTINAESKSVFNINFAANDPESLQVNPPKCIWRQPNFKKVWAEVKPFEPTKQAKAIESKFNYFESSYRVTTDSKSWYTSGKLCLNMQYTILQTPLPDRDLERV